MDKSAPIGDDGVEMAPLVKSERTPPDLAILARNINATASRHTIIFDPSCLVAVGSGSRHVEAVRTMPAASNENIGNELSEGTRAKNARTTIKTEGRDSRDDKESTGTRAAGADSAASVANGCEEDPIDRWKMLSAEADRQVRSERAARSKRDLLRAQEPIATTMPLTVDSGSNVSPAASSLAAMSSIDSPDLDVNLASFVTTTTSLTVSTGLRINTESTAANTNLASSIATNMLLTANPGLAASPASTSSSAGLLTHVSPKRVRAPLVDYPCSEDEAEEDGRTEDVGTHEEPTSPVAVRAQEIDSRSAGDNDEKEGDGGDREHADDRRVEGKIPSNMFNSIRRFSVVIERMTQNMIRSSSVNDGDGVNGGDTREIPPKTSRGRKVVRMTKTPVISSDSIDATEKKDDGKKDDNESEPPKITCGRKAVRMTKPPVISSGSIDVTEEKDDGDKESNESEPPKIPRGRKVVRMTKIRVISSSSDSDEDDDFSLYNRKRKLPSGERSVLSENKIARKVFEREDGSNYEVGDVMASTSKVTKDHMVADEETPTSTKKPRVRISKKYSDNVSNKMTTSSKPRQVSAAHLNSNGRDEEADETSRKKRSDNDGNKTRKVSATRSEREGDENSKNVYSLRKHRMEAESRADNSDGAENVYSLRKRCMVTESRADDSDGAEKLSGENAYSLRKRRMETESRADDSYNDDKDVDEESGDESTSTKKLTPVPKRARFRSRSNGKEDDSEVSSERLIKTRSNDRGKESRAKSASSSQKAREAIDAPSDDEDGDDEDGDDEDGDESKHAISRLSTKKVEKPHVCDVCDLGFAFASRLEYHVNSVHLGLTKTDCPVCGKTLGSKASLKTHVASVHEKLDEFKCEECEFVCFQKGHLKRHVNTVHKEVKEFQCAECEFGTAHKDSLKKHVESVHRKLKEFKCRDCDYACYAKISLKRHFDSMHSDVKRYLCGECEFGCALKIDLTRHVAGAHREAKKFRCAECTYSANYKSQLDLHVAGSHSEDKAYECDLCPFKTSWKSCLTKHQRKMHGQEK